MQEAGEGRRRSTPAIFVGLLRERRFATLFAAHLGSTLGDWLAFLALWTVVGIDGGGGAPELAALAGAYLLPLAVVMPVAATCVDRWPLRRVLIGADFLRAGVVAGFVWVDGLWGRCALLAALQALGCFFNPAQAAAMARLVPRERLVAANALTTQAGHASKLAGPALAGIVVAAWGAHAAFWIDAASFGWSALLLATLPSMPVARDAAHGFAATAGPWSRAWHDVSAGARFAWRERAIRDVVASVLVAAGGLGAWVATFAVVARDRWGVAARGTGLLVSGAGAGAILGAAVAVPLAHRFGTAAVARGAVAVVAVALAGGAAATTRPWAIAMTLLLGAATAAVFVPAAATVQSTTPSARLGRVQGAAIASIGLVQAVCIGVCGLATRSVSATTLLFVAAFATAAGAVVLQIVSRGGKRDTQGSPSI